MEPRIHRNLYYAWQALEVIVLCYARYLSDAQLLKVTQCRRLLGELLRDFPEP